MIPTKTSDLDKLEFHLCSKLGGNIPNLFKINIESDFSTSDSPLPNSEELVNKLFPTIDKTKSKLMSGKFDMYYFNVIDNRYLEYFKVRSKLLETKPSSVICCKPGTHLACAEAFVYIIYFIVKKYPTIFEVIYIGSIIYLHNKFTKLTIRIDDFITKDTLMLLKIIGLTVQEDFSIITKEEGKYILGATLTAFPVGWYPSQRTGMDMISLHANATHWRKGKAKYATQHSTVFEIAENGRAVKRTSLFIYNTPLLHLPYWNSPAPSSSQINTYPNYRYSDIHIRREYQSFIYLPLSGTFLFGVRTYTVPMTSMGTTDLLELRELVSKWDKAQADYHQKETWFPVLNHYIEYRFKDI